MLENFSVHQIISKIKKREIKIVEVLNFYLDRIKKFNPKLNAIISHIDETKITEEAKLKDENLIVIMIKMIFMVFQLLLKNYLILKMR